MSVTVAPRSVCVVAVVKVHRRLMWGVDEVKDFHALTIGLNSFVEQI